MPTKDHGAMPHEGMHKCESISPLVKIPNANVVLVEELIDPKILGVTEIVSLRT